MSREHGPLLDFDGDCWVLICQCGKYLGGYDTEDEAAEIFADHVAGIYEGMGH